MCKVLTPEPGQRWQEGLVLTELQKRILLYDAAPLVERLLLKGRINPQKRYQSIGVDHILLPVSVGLCACGCGQAVVPPKRKWATKECWAFPYTVLDILRGDTELIARYLRLLHGHVCAHCKQSHDSRGFTLELDCDHIVPVAEGGAGRWLDNYQLLCKSCHKLKTAEQVRLKAETNRLKKLCCGDCGTCPKKGGGTT
jgi:5-methylcytosine-specific restriction endonuclease McrA